MIRTAKFPGIPTVIKIARYTIGARSFLISFIFDIIVFTRSEG
jgi:hypothetical protein